ncbi:MAG: DUF1987 domain-containing protein [Flavobacteriales bacterium]|nr:DUF1987 domain-containing protein [Flavobacteriales bacterium]
MRIELEKSETTPEIILDLDQKTLKIKGHSTPENTSDFYGPIIKALVENYGKGNLGINIHIELEYFNTSTSKALYDIFEIVDSHEDLSSKIEWFAEADDQEIKEAGAYFQKMFSNLNFTIKDI